MTQWGLDALFNPAKRHMDEEKRRLQATREQIGDSSGGKRIDLESGKVTIRRGNGPDSGSDEEPASEHRAESDDATAGEPASENEPESATAAETAPETGTQSASASSDDA